MFGMMVAYDTSGVVVATLEWLTLTDDATGEVLGAVDFSQAEADGVRLKELWEVGGAAGSATWPQWLPAHRMPEFKVDIDNRFSNPLRRLVHAGRTAVDHPDPRFRQAEVPGSGHVLERSEIDAEVASRIKASHPAPADIRDVTGGPDYPLRLDERGQVIGRSIVAIPGHKRSVDLARYLAVVPPQERT